MYIWDVSDVSKIKKVTEYNQNIPVNGILRNVKYCEHALPTENMRMECHDIYASNSRFQQQK